MLIINFEKEIPNAKTPTLVKHVHMTLQVSGYLCLAADKIQGENPGR
jgi:hypothetical protein